MSTVRWVANCLWASTAPGLFIGAFVGGVYAEVTIFLVPYGGFFLGFFFGAIIGLLIGAVNGVILALVIRLWFFSPNQVRAHMRSIGNLGLVLGTVIAFALVTSLLLPTDQAQSWPLNIAHWKVFYPVVPALIAGGVLWKLNRSIIRWFLLQVSEPPSVGGSA
ncbi:MAG TPA: hypothetical protein VHV31_06590 [Nitrolancea sp.]|nr:hypothetical protein [Nitrolancea sp.]